MNDSMDAYLDYLRTRLDKVKSSRKFTYNDRKSAEAEYSRAVAFARRNGQTVRYALPENQDDAAA